MRRRRGTFGSRKKHTRCKPEVYCLRHAEENIADGDIQKDFATVEEVMQRAVVLILVLLLIYQVAMLEDFLIIIW